jgi:SynChlorMet cassette protein ScmC
MKSSRVSFGLTLANQQSWCFEAEVGLRPWLQEFARLMELERCESEMARKVILIPMDYTPSKENVSLCNAVKGLDSLKKKESASKGLRREQAMRSVEYETDWKGVEFAFMVPMPSSRAMQAQLMCDALVPVYEAVEENGGLVLHASLVARNDEGALLLGSSGVGKSTCSERIQPPWRSLCDDLVLVVKVDSGVYRAHPLPTWSYVLSGYSSRKWKVREHTSVRAIFFLEQGETDLVEKVGNGQAAVSLYNCIGQIYRREASMSSGEKRIWRKKLFENSCELVKAVPSFLLRVNLRGRFWQSMDEVM